MPLGSLMIDLEGHVLTEEEKILLKHPLVGGVILFSRNYDNPIQLIELTSEIHQLRQPALLISVDHEGGRIQRFRHNFVSLPACAKFGQLYQQNQLQAVSFAEQIGWLLAAELRAVGVDFSFAPVLDLKRGISTVVDDRAFHHDPEIVAKLAQAMMNGMHKAGMVAVGKHFPGHGSVAADSHHAIPIDERPLVDIQFADLIPFERLVKYGLAAIMPAHVIYPQVDSLPAGFSPIWLQRILRQELQFQGVIFSDDLMMAGASMIGDAVERARQALQAGCDMILVCNNRPAVLNIIDALGDYHSVVAQARLIRLHGQTALDWHTLHADQRWCDAQQVCYLLNQEPELDLSEDKIY